MNKYLLLRNKSGMISFLIERKSILVITTLTLFIIFLFIIGIGIGSVNIHPVDVFYTLIGQGTKDHNLIIQTLRLPRAIVSLLVGIALGISGAILQGMIRNPLASPDIIGITNGASFGAIAFITIFSGTYGLSPLPFAAMLGAALIALLIYFLAWKKGVTPIRLVLIGIGLNEAMRGLIIFMILFSPMYKASQAYVWLTGSIYAAKWEHVQTILPWVLVFVPLAFIFARSINVQELGDETAAGLGAPVQLHRFMLLFISVVLVGSAAAVAGAISFVGLIAPHIARKLVGRSFGSVLPVSALVGGLIVFLADLVARTAFTPLDIPAGVFTAGIGAPFFIYLLYRNRNM
jgi:iron complex transport system permease protein